MSSCDSDNILRERTETVRPLQLKAQRAHKLLSLHSVGQSKSQGPYILLEVFQICVRLVQK